MQQQQEILSSAVERDLIKDEVATLSTRKEKEEKAIKEIEAQYEKLKMSLSHKEYAAKRREQNQTTPALISSAYGI